MISVLMCAPVLSHRNMYVFEDVCMLCVVYVSGNVMLFVRVYVLFNLCE